MEGCRIVGAVNTGWSARQNYRGAKNDRTIVWSFKSSHYRRGYMVVKTKKRRYVTIIRSQSMCDTISNRSEQNV
jgi:hypothetical protein